MNKDLNKLDDIIIFYSKEEALVTLPSIFTINDFKDINYNNRFLTFITNNDEKKIVVLKPVIMKKINSYKNIFLLDTTNYTNAVVVLKENNILIKE